jgi:hypothetical protein
MITGAINLLIWTLLIFFVGMYKPKWPLFFMKNPNRFTIMVVTMILFMITATIYGEGLRRGKGTEYRRKAFRGQLDSRIWVTCKIK